jgi:hypothetical protein
MSKANLCIHIGFAAKVILHMWFYNLCPPVSEMTTSRNLLQEWSDNLKQMRRNFNLLITKICWKFVKVSNIIIILQTFCDFIDQRLWHRLKDFLVFAVSKTYILKGVSTTSFKKVKLIEKNNEHIHVLSFTLGPFKFCSLFEPPFLFLKSILRLTFINHALLIARNKFNGQLCERESRIKIALY